jgi:hypothetical protein
MNFQNDFILRLGKGATCFEHSKVMSVHFSTCTSYDFNSLTPVV